MGRMEISSIQNVDTQLKLDEQKATLDEVQSDIDRLSETLEREQAKVHSRNQAGRKDLDKAISALAITSTIFTLVVSGTIFVSVHDIATQAADLSRLSGSQINTGKRNSPVLIRTGSRGTHSDVGPNGNRTSPALNRPGSSEAHSDMGLNKNRIMGAPTAIEKKIDFGSNSPKWERQRQDVTVSAEEDLGLFEKAWNNPDRLSKGGDLTPMDSHGCYKIPLSCFLRQLPPANLGFIVKFGTQDQCDRGHYYQWRDHRLERIEWPDQDLSIHDFKTALVCISHLDDFDRLKSQIPPSRTQSAACLFRDWYILKLDRKDRTPHYVITVATDEYHIPSSEPGLRISHAEYDNTLQYGHHFVSDTKESAVSGLVEDLPSLLATTIVSLSACFAVRSYSLPDCCSCSSIFDPKNWRAYNDDLGGCMSP